MRGQQCLLLCGALLHRGFGLLHSFLGMQQRGGLRCTLLLQIAGLLLRVLQLRLLSLQLALQLLALLQLLAPAAELLAQHGVAGILLLQLSQITLMSL